MKKIQVTQGNFALVDNADFKFLNQYRWCILKSGNQLYARHSLPRINGKNKHILMHVLILDTPKGMDTDHKDGNGLNNQRKNLRICTRSENQRNRGVQKGNIAGIKGVSLHRHNKKWTAQICLNKKKVYLGSFDTKEKAGDAYRRVCIKYHGEYAKMEPSPTPVR